MPKGYSLSLDNVPKELKLQLEIMKRKTTEELKGIDKGWFTYIDWDQFLELAMHHRVYPFIYQKMKEIDPMLIPEYVMHRLQQNYKMNTFQMLFLSGEMEQISKLFTGNEIRTLF